MADNSLIEWCDATWQPVTGCHIVSPGCANCYAMRLAGTRLAFHPSRKGLTRDTAAGPVWTGEVRFNEQWLDQPLRWRAPRRIFVCAHGDLFAENVPDDWIDRVFAVMQRAGRHTFVVLTKRSGRARAYLERLYAEADANKRGWYQRGFCWPLGSRAEMSRDRVVPFPNVWLGVSVEDQARADERIPLLLDTPAAIRFISAEPLLGPIDLTDITAAHLGEPVPDQWDALSREYDDRIGAPGPRLDWVIVGGESGAGARPMHPDWARALRDQCTEAGVAFFFKQWGEWIAADMLAAMLEPAALLPLDARQAAALAAGRPQHNSDGIVLIRAGRSLAGRRLDGREWSEFPA